MNAHKLALLHALTDIAANGPKHEHWGICTYVTAALCDTEEPDSEAHGELAAMFKRWPESGGCTAFPVEGNAVDYLGNRHKWDVSTKFGAKRYRLLAYLIHELSKEYHASLH